MSETTFTDDSGNPVEWRYRGGVFQVRYPAFSVGLPHEGWYEPAVWEITPALVQHLASLLPPPLP